MSPRHWRCGGTRRRRRAGAESGPAVALPAVMNQLKALRGGLLAGLSLAALSSSAPANAQGEERVVEVVDDPSVYPIEVEPHFTFGPDNVYGNAGVGAGLRLSIPVVSSLLVRVPDNLAISFGADLIHY